MTKGAAIARFGGVGDNLITASVIPGLKKKYGRVDVLSKAPYSCVYEGNPHVDRLIHPDMDSIPNDSVQWQKWFTSRGKEYDFFINFSHTLEVVGALQITQSQFYWPEKYRRKWAGESYLLRTLELCDLEPESMDKLYYSTPEEEEKAFDTKAVISQDFIAWVLSGTRIDKVYPHAAITIARLIKEVGPVAMLGSPGPQFEQAKKIEETVALINGSHAGLHTCLSPTTDAQGNQILYEKLSWPIRRICTWANTSRVVVGPDTGPMWSVALERTPKVLLLSHASPRNISYLWRNTITLHADPDRVSCWPCHRLHEDISTCRKAVSNESAACMDNISVDEVVQAVKEAWTMSTPTPMTTTQ